MIVWAVSLLTTEIIPRSLTPEISVTVFGVWLKAVGWWPPRFIQSLYPRSVVARG